MSDKPSGDGIQCVTYHVPGWAGPYNLIYATERDMRVDVGRQLNYWRRFTPGPVELVWYGYDPRVLADDEITEIGTDGHPDCHATVEDLDAWDGDFDTIDWQPA